MARSVILARLLSRKIVSRRIRSLPPYPNLALQLISTTVDESRVGTNVMLTRTEGVGAAASSTSSSRFARPNKTDDVDELDAASSKDTLENDDDDDDETEQEDMFVDAHPTFEFQGKEWGGPRRGGRLPEPTRYGDWERKGRCSDF